MDRSRTGEEVTSPHLSSSRRERSQLACSIYRQPPPAPQAIPTTLSKCLSRLDGPLTAAAAVVVVAADKAEEAEEMEKVLVETVRTLLIQRRAGGIRLLVHNHSSSREEWRLAEVEVGALLPFLSYRSSRGSILGSILGIWAQRTGICSIIEDMAQ